MSQREVADSRRNTILVTGYARLPEGEGRPGDPLFGVSLEVDPEGDRILDAECSCASGIGRDFFTRVVRGRSFTGELPEIIREVERRMAVPAQKSIIRSLQNAYNRYREFKLTQQSALVRTYPSGSAFDDVGAYVGRPDRRVAGS